MSEKKWLERNYYIYLGIGDECIDFTPLKNLYYHNKDTYIARLRFFKNLRRHKNLKKYLDNYLKYDIISISDEER